MKMNRNRCAAVAFVCFFAIIAMAAPVTAADTSMAKEPTERAEKISAAAVPKEPFPVVETTFTFTEPLKERQKTDMIVIHHVGIPAGDTTAAAIHAAHLANGWAGIGYHYVIRKDGTIERGRPVQTVGAHAYGENEHTVGINVTGNFDTEKPTAAQIQSLETLLTWLCQYYHIEPGVTTIVGHRDLNSTDCPGQQLYEQLPRIRQDVKVRLAEQQLENTPLKRILNNHGK